ncbi:MAG: phosphodiester glycosidase family protein [Candidatus Limnocylindrales bacterium]
MALRFGMAILAGAMATFLPGTVAPAVPDAVALANTSSSSARTVSSAESEVISRDYAASSDEQLAPGVTHSTGAMFTGDGLRQQVHVVVADTSDGSVKVQPLLSNDLVAGRERTSALANRYSASHSGMTAVAGVNGDFWWPGLTVTPRGLHIQNGEVMTSGPTGLPTLGVTATGSLRMDNVRVVVRAIDGAGGVTVNHVNGYRRLGQAVIYTPRFRSTTGTTDDGTEVILAVEGTLAPRGRLNATVVEVRRGAGNSPIGAGQMVLSANGTWAGYLASLQPGHKLAVASNVTIEGWESVVQAVGGDQFLVRDGVASTGISGRHPRTSAGLTSDGKLLMVTVDGRQPGYSHGVSAEELGALMKQLGAVHALNFDGGGSTTMAVRSPGSDYVRVVNSPSDGGERAVTSSLAVFSTTRTSATALDKTAPTMPTNRTAEALGNQQVTLSWSASTDDRPGTIFYRVRRNGVRIAEVTEPIYIDQPPLPGTYAYKIRAVDAAGNRTALTRYVVGDAIAGSL